MAIRVHVLGILSNNNSRNMSTIYNVFNLSKRLTLTSFFMSVCLQI